MRGAFRQRCDMANVYGVTLRPDLLIAKAIRAVPVVEVAMEKAA